VSSDVFRKSLRIPRPADPHSVDSLVYQRLVKLDEESPHRAQEWIRGALRNEVMREVEVMKVLAKKEVPDGEGKQ
jgi:hypothetical protein